MSYEGQSRFTTGSDRIEWHCGRFFGPVRGEHRTRNYLVMYRLNSDVRGYCLFVCYGL
jgi:hypothetical protein